MPVSCISFIATACRGTPIFSILKYLANLGSSFTLTKLASSGAASAGGSADVVAAADDEEASAFGGGGGGGGGAPERWWSFNDELVTIAEWTTDGKGVQA